MKPIPLFHRREWTSRIVPFIITLAVMPAAVLITRNVARAGGTVTDCTEASLRAAMAGGGTVTFACDGTITLSNTVSISENTFLEAGGHRVTINGNGSVRVFQVGTNVLFTVDNLTIANGLATNGAGLFNAGGVVTVTNSTFCGNNVLGAAAPFYPHAGGESVGGGAVANLGVLKLVNCTFTNNSAVGGAGSSDSYSFGVAGDVGGNGAGGAVWNAGLMFSSGCTFAGNSVTGGTGGAGASGYPFPWNNPGYPGGLGGDGIGGAIFNCGTACFVNCTLALNTGEGGAGGQGGPAYYNSPSYPPVSGSPGGSGGCAGGSVFNCGTASFVNCTLAFNTGQGGAGGSGGAGTPGGPYYPPGSPGLNGSPGLSVGGICDTSGDCYLTNCTVAFNSGMGIWTTETDGTKLINTLLAGNSPGGNGSGAMTDLGHNLSSDSTCAFTNSGSMNHTDPKLGPLTDNGGPTLTMALLPGSPATDAGGALGAPTTDQRGAPRPQGSSVDIGAFEYLYSPVFTGAAVQTWTNRQMLLNGLTPNPALTLQASSNLLNWWGVTNFTTGSNGVFQCADPVPGDAQARFYRLKSGAP